MPEHGLTLQRNLIYIG